jgi:hypothetical protein
MQFILYSILLFKLMVFKLNDKITNINNKTTNLNNKVGINDDMNYGTSLKHLKNIIPN